jgi:hypothetical protein
MSIMNPELYEHIVSKIVDIFMMLRDDIVCNNEETA